MEENGADLSRIYNIRHHCRSISQVLLGNKLYFE